MLAKLQKWVSRTVGPSASLEALAHHRNVDNLSLFYRYKFGRCSPELDELAPLPHSRKKSTRYSNSLHDFSVTIPRYHKYVYVNSFTSLWNSLPLE